jgi:ABC-type oligopeptide transport system substrate-binding subunit
MHVDIGPVLPFFSDGLDHLASTLTSLGYEVTVDRNSDPDHFFANASAAHANLNGWAADYLGPGNFLGLFKCPGDPFIGYCDESGEFDAAFERAIQLQPTDRAAANAAWAELDRWVVDQAILAPIFNAGATFVSDRVGNYQYSPTGAPLYDQMWVQ